jgi:hypothetical protein
MIVATKLLKNKSKRVEKGKKPSETMVKRRFAGTEPV